jgi:hypothetical protein
VLILYADTDTTAITEVVDLRNLSPITETIEPDLYGLVNDDLTDNTDAYQEMVDALPEGSVVKFGRGIYRFSAITISKGITLEGSGSYLDGTVLRTTHASADAITIETEDQVRMRGFVLDSSVTRVGGYGILNAGNNILSKFEDITFDGHYDQIGFTSGRGWVVKDCQFINTSHADIVVDNGESPADCDAEIKGCVFASDDVSGTQGILVVNGVGLTISGNRILTHEQGIVVSPTTVVAGININNNTFRNQAVVPISFYRPSGSGVVSQAHINNNIMHTTGTHGIFFGADAADVFVDGKINDNLITVTDTEGVGIQLQGDANFLVDGNNLILPTGDASIGISITSLSTDANIGLNAIIADTILEKNGVNTTITPIGIPGSVTYNPPEIAAGTQVELTVTAAAVLAGDQLILHRPPLSEWPEDIIFGGFGPGEAGQFKIYLYNKDGSPVNPGAGTMEGFIIRTP